MGYRINSKPKHKPQRTAVDLATPAKLYMRNGTVAQFAFPCWYQEVHKPIPAHHHDHHWHDHVGWPSPDHPDHVCQLWAPDRHCCSIGHHHECSPHCEHYVDMANVFPIHFLEEGYSTDVGVNYSSHDEVLPEGIVMVAKIDEKEDWVIRLCVEAHDPNAIDEKAVYRFSIVVNAIDEDDMFNQRTDTVVIGDLIVLPAPL